MISIYLGLGSNLGDRAANLREATERMKRLGLRVTRESSIYETEPVGYQDQPWFLNQVIEIQIALDSLAALDAETFALTRTFFDADPVTAHFIMADDLWNGLLRIENEMGRERLIPDGPRTIDIDLLLYGGELFFMATTEGTGMARAHPPSLIVPHPRMHLRRFVLEPLCEIAPDLIHPTTGKTIRQLLAELDDPAIVRKMPRLRPA